jgi:hypothetical protein
MSLKYSVVAVSAIDTPLKKNMFSLFSRYYADVDFERFAADLSEKTSVIMLWDKSNAAAPLLFGFSTVLIRELTEGGRIIYSGDTVVDSDYWGSRTLQTAFSRMLFQTRLRHPFSPLYWMLISKGFKTYMLMRRNFRDSHPNCYQEPPSALLKIKHEFYRGKFGVNYKDGSSVIDFGHSLGRVKDQLAVPTERDLKNPEVRFFLQKNPRFAEGVELACIANVRWSDIAWMISKYVFPFLKVPAPAADLVRSPG